MHHPEREQTAPPAAPRGGKHAGRGKITAAAGADAACAAARTNEPREHHGRGRGVSHYGCRASFLSSSSLVRLVERFQSIANTLFYGCSRWAALYDIGVVGVFGPSATSHCIMRLAVAAAVLGFASAFVVLPPQVYLGMRIALRSRVRGVEFLRGVGCGGHKAPRVRFNPVWQGGVGRGVRKCWLLRGSRSARGPRVSPSSPSALLGAAEPPPGFVLTEQERGKDNTAPDEYFYDYPRICFHADAAWHAQVVHGVRMLPGHAVEKLTLNVGTGVSGSLRQSMRNICHTGRTSKFST
jgi:hypothetical protein